MRIDAFQTPEEFKQRMDQWIENFQNSESIEGQPEVLIPGDPERQMEEKTQNEGIDILPAIQQDLKELANKLNLKFELK
jgi:LDH2 family malate/lactate/ureidoglycolate dehydrogenase